MPWPLGVKSLEGSAFQKTNIKLMLPEKGRLETAHAAENQPLHLLFAVNVARRKSGSDTIIFAYMKNNNYENHAGSRAMTLMFRFDAPAF